MKTKKFTFLLKTEDNNRFSNSQEVVWKLFLKFIWCKWLVMH